MENLFQFGKFIVQLKEKRYKMNNLHLKQDLSSHQLAVLNSELEAHKKSPLIAYLLWFFFGGLGAHRYYLGNIGMGIAMTLTLGGLGIWAFIDVFFINGRLKEINQQTESDLIMKIKAMDSQRMAG